MGVGLDLSFRWLFYVLVGVYSVIMLVGLRHRLAVLTALCCCFGSLLWLLFVGLFASLLACDLVCLVVCLDVFTLLADGF